MIAFILKTLLDFDPSKKVSNKWKLMAQQEYVAVFQSMNFNPLPKVLFKQTETIFEKLKKLV